MLEIRSITRFRSPTPRGVDWLKNHLAFSRPLRGFTLVELVVVILILGILAAVAAPRLLEVGQGATENGLKHTLGIVGDAIELFAAQNAGQKPGFDGTEATLLSDLAPFIRGAFPDNPYKESNTVAVQTSGAPITSTVGAGFGWIYDNLTGQFVANSNGMSSDEVRRYREL